MYILISSILLLIVIFYILYLFSASKQQGRTDVFNSISVMLCMIALDRIIKYWAVKEVAQKSIGLIDGVFRFSYVENRGMAFGMLQNQRWLFISLTSVLIIAGLFWLYKYKPEQPFTKAAILMIAGGGIGNLIDRVCMGYVVDMFDFCLINFPVFNVADCFVCVGAAALIIGILLTPEKEKVKSVEND